MQLSQFTNSVRVTFFLTDNKSYVHNKQCAEDRDGMHSFPISSHFLFISSFSFFISHTPKSVRHQKRWTKTLATKLNRRIAEMVEM